MCLRSHSPQTSPGLAARSLHAAANCARRRQGASRRPAGRDPQRRRTRTAARIRAPASNTLGDPRYRLRPASTQGTGGKVQPGELKPTTGGPLIRADRRISRTGADQRQSQMVTGSHESRGPCRACPYAVDRLGDGSGSAERPFCRCCRRWGSGAAGRFGFRIPVVAECPEASARAALVAGRAAGMPLLCRAGGGHVLRCSRRRPSARAARACRCRACCLPAGRPAGPAQRTGRRGAIWPWVTHPWR
jgi:hypothetical protein